MDTTALLLLTVGVIIGSSLGYVFGASRNFDRMYGSLKTAEPSDRAEIRGDVSG